MCTASDHQDTISCADAQEAVPPVDNRFDTETCSVTIDACAALVDARLIALVRAQDKHGTPAVGLALREMQMLSEQIRFLKNSY